MKMPAWSFSSLNDFLNCALSYYLKRVAKKYPQKETEAMRHGNIQHTHLELRVKDGNVLPPELQWMETYIAKMKSTGAEMIAEQSVGITAGLQPTGFFSDDVWARGKLDLTLRYEHSSTVLDYKTGKRKFDSDQLMLFAGFEMAIRPEIKIVKTGYIWLKDKAIDSETYQRDDLGKIWGHFMPKVERMSDAYEKNNWPARPSGLCGWCPATKADCKHARS